VLSKHNLKMGADLVPKNVWTRRFRFRPKRSSRYDGLRQPHQLPRQTHALDPKTDPFTDLFARAAAYQCHLCFSGPPHPWTCTNWEQGYFFQDDWKMTPRLTINLSGLRYELISTIYRQRTTFCSNFDPTGNNGAGRIIVPSSKTIQFLDPRISRLVFP